MTQRCPCGSQMTVEKTKTYSKLEVKCCVKCIRSQMCETFCIRTKWIIAKSNKHEGHQNDGLDVYQNDFQMFMIN